VGGLAATAIHPDTNRIVATSTFIPLIAIDGYFDFFVTAQHEIGHNLGLAHQFVRDLKTGKLVYPSVMSYDYLSLGNYDFEAIEAAYGPYP
jgi:hypothetical protein